eukprot:9503875-Pyramimonas_sp.AAC.3
MDPEYGTWWYWCIQRSDMFRIAVMHARGGIYADADIIPVIDIPNSDSSTHERKLGSLYYRTTQLNVTSPSVSPWSSQSSKLPA